MKNVAKHVLDPLFDSFFHIESLDRNGLMHLSYRYVGIAVDPRFMDLDSVSELFKVRYACHGPEEILRKTMDFISYMDAKILVPLAIDAMNYVDGVGTPNDDGLPSSPPNKPSLFGFSVNANSKEEKAKADLNNFRRSVFSNLNPNSASECFIKI